MFSEDLEMILLEQVYPEGFSSSQELRKENTINKIKYTCC